MVAGERPWAAGWGSGQEATEAIAQCFFNLFIDVPRCLLCLEARSGGVGGGQETIIAKSTPSAGKRRGNYSLIYRH